MIEVKIKKQEDALVVHVEGRVDGESVQQLEKCLLDQIMDRNERHVVVDLSNLFFISSKGLHLLLTISKILDLLGGKIAMVGVSDSIQEMMDLAGLTLFIPVYGKKPQVHREFQRLAYGG